jgi:ElaB/YqjD/DUF883 family membrane-anchored ribosome-binding protein
MSDKNVMDFADDAEDAGAKIDQEARRTASAARQQGQGTAASASGVLGGAQEKLGDAASRAQEKLGDAVSGAQEKLGDAVSGAQEKLGDAVSGAQEQLSQVNASLGWVGERPWMSFGAAVVVGYALGAMGGGAASAKKASWEGVRAMPWSEPVQNTADFTHEVVKRGAGEPRQVSPAPSKPGAPQSGYSSAGAFTASQPEYSSTSAFSKPQAEQSSASAYGGSHEHSSTSAYGGPQEHSPASAYGGPQEHSLASAYSGPHTGEFAGLSAQSQPSSWSQQRGLTHSTQSGGASEGVMSQVGEELNLLKRAAIGTIKSMVNDATKTYLASSATQPAVSSTERERLP